MDTISKKIYEIIKANNGIKAREIAKQLNIEKSDVNHYLYGELKKYCYQDSSYTWFIKATERSYTPVQDTTITAIKNLKNDKVLENLAQYYLDCIVLDGGNKVSCFKDSRFDSVYIEVNHTDEKIFEEEGVGEFILKSSRARKVTYLGYPVLSYSFLTKK